MNQFRDNFQNLPKWLLDAYHNDQTVNRVVKDWRMTTKPLSALYEELALRLYELKNQWQMTAEHEAAKHAIVFKREPWDATKPA